MAKIICCDLSKKDGEDYENFMNAIVKHEGCCKVTDSCWVVSTTESPKQIRDNLLQYLDSKDRLFVANLEKGSGAWSRISESSDILQNILKLI
jgi:hypothetical protein